MFLNRLTKIFLILAVAGFVLPQGSHAQTKSVFFRELRPKIGEMRAVGWIDVHDEVEHPISLMWDESNGHLLITEPSTNTVHVVEENSGEFRSPMNVHGLGSGPAVFDSARNGFLVVDRPKAFSDDEDSVAQKPRRIVFHQIDPGVASEGQTPNFVNQFLNLQPITGLALDNNGDQWISAGGGLCACIYRESFEEGEDSLGFFPGCDPLGISIDPKSEWLWIAARNADDRGAVFLRRSLHSLKEHRELPYSALHTVQYLHIFVEEEMDIQVKAFVATKDALWVLHVPDASDENSRRVLYQFDPSQARPIDGGE